MSTLAEQFSAARKSQVEAQLDFFQNFSAKAVESTEKIVALNLATTRALMAKTSADALQLLTAKDPRDLFALTTQTQASFDTLLAYGRALASIAGGAQEALLPAQRAAAPGPSEPAPAPSAPAPAPSAPASAQVELELADSTGFAPEITAEDSATALPAAEPTPIAKAASKAVKAAPARPAAAPVAKARAPVAVTGLKAVESEPPPARVSGTPNIVVKSQSKQQEPAAPKAKKKK